MKAALDYFAQNNQDIGSDCNEVSYTYSDKNAFSYLGGSWKDPMYQPCKVDCTTNCAFCSAECASNYVILVSDGDWNTGDDPMKPAWYMHNKFKRILNNTAFTINRVYKIGMSLDTSSGYCGFNALKNVSLYGSNNFPTYPTDCPSCKKTVKIRIPITLMAAIVIQQTQILPLLIHLPHLAQTMQVS